MKKTLFIGCVESSYVLLECLLKNGYFVAGVVTMERSDSNSDFKSLAPLAAEYGIACFCTKNVNDAETMDFIKSINPEIIYCFGWSRLIGKELLAIPKHGVIGFHPAELPFNRGRHPLIWALVLGLERTASSFFVMDEGADTGDIISQEPILIDYEDDARTLYDKVLETAKGQVLEFTELFSRDAVRRVPQSMEGGNSWRKRGKPDGQIDWRMSCAGIRNLVRALTHPYVGAHFMCGDREVRVWRCEIEPSPAHRNIEPGKVLHVNSSKDYFIKAYDGMVHVLDSDAVSLKEGEYL